MELEHEQEEEAALEAAAELEAAEETEVQPSPEDIRNAMTLAELAMERARPYLETEVKGPIGKGAYRSAEMTAVQRTKLGKLVDTIADAHSRIRMLAKNKLALAAVIAVPTIGTAVQTGLMDARLRRDLTDRIHQEQDRADAAEKKLKEKKEEKGPDLLEIQWEVMNEIVAQPDSLKELQTAAETGSAGAFYSKLDGLVQKAFSQRGVYNYNYDRERVFFNIRNDFFHKVVTRIAETDPKAALRMVEAIEFSPLELKKLVPSVPNGLVVDALHHGLEYGGYSYGPEALFWGNLDQLGSVVNALPQQDIERIRRWLHYKLEEMLRVLRSPREPIPGGGADGNLMAKDELQQALEILNAARPRH